MPQQKRLLHAVLILALAAGCIFAQPTATKRFPGPGIPVPEGTRAALQQKLVRLQTSLSALPPALDPVFVPDARIYEKAVRYALEHDEFYRTNEFAIAEKLLEEGLRRAESLSQNSAPWTQQTGLVVRAYRSRIDGSIQPFGLVVPSSFRANDTRKYRLDIWLHGRDETLTELKFINERSPRPGEFTPPDAFVLHPYGRYCNAFKFAGEIDVLEAIEAVRRMYPIDDSRVLLRGFSMGGAGVWHLAVHHADRWLAAAPGAGFAESAEYLRLNVETIRPFERVLWQWYDATDCTANLRHCPTIAYSGELDKQRQAADVMASALAREGLPLAHLIGPKTEHKYEPETKRLLNNVIDTLALTPKPDCPREIRFTTRTLRYSRMYWLQLLGLEKHWRRADAMARLEGDRVRLSLTNVTRFAIELPSHAVIREVDINGDTVPIPATGVAGSVVISRMNNTWSLLTSSDSRNSSHPKSKSPGLQGPIDDAFLDSFVFVTPSQAGFHEKTAAWVNEELARARYEWRAQFRGEAPTLRDADVTPDNIRDSNLVLWGDPASNAVLGKILPNLPLQWSRDRIQIGTVTFDARTHIPLLIYPNPLNPKRYIVLNSGFTFRGFGSNASQTPKLPDYALLDLGQPDPFANGLVAAGFFDESWKFDRDSLYLRDR